MKRTIIAALTGTLAGLVIGGAPSLAQDRDRGRDRPEYVGNGYRVECRGNGNGGYRRCDVYVPRFGTVRRMDLNMYVGNRFAGGMNHYELDNFRSGFRVVR